MTTIRTTRKPTLQERFEAVLRMEINEWTHDKALDYAWRTIGEFKLEVRRRWVRGKGDWDHVVRECREANAKLEEVLREFFNRQATRRY